MALTDRIGSDGDISVHSFSASVYLMERGIITSGTVISRFNLSVEDQVQLGQLTTFYNSLNATEKASFHGRFESLNILFAEGYMTLTEYKNLLGLT
jgi:hypothetical protein